MDVLNFALRYLGLGWSVIPVDSRVKDGAPFSWKPFQNRPPTEDEIREWCVRWPDHGLALICGQVSGLCVIDLDRHGANDGLEAVRSAYGWEPGEAYPTVVTGGGGLHVYCRHPGPDVVVKNRTGAGAILPGVELKGDGGFVYAPPNPASGGQGQETDAERVATDNKLPTFDNA